MARQRNPRLEVVMPVTVSGVVELLAAMAAALVDDAVRYQKANRTAASHPAVMDKTESALVIREAIDKIQAGNKSRWQEIGEE